jgi:hypothetical protein
MTDSWAEHYNAVYGQDTSTEGIAHGWIQWKGTSVCMDLHCLCGHHSHVDAEFCYNVECPNCKKMFAVGQVVKLIPLTPQQSNYVNELRNGFVTGS